MSASTKIIQAAAGLGGEPEGAWDLSYAYYDDPFSGDFDTLSYNFNYAQVGAQETNPHGVFFKPDGTKMYVVGTTGDDVNEYDLSTAWDVTTASYLQNFDVSNDSGNPEEIHFKPDGTKMYIVTPDNDQVSEYELSTAWDVTSASYARAESVNSEDSSPSGLWFKPDGTKMYITGQSTSTVYEYDLSTPWLVTSASLLQSFDVSNQMSFPRGVAFNNDGDEMLVVDTGSEVLDKYELSTPWDVSSASHLGFFSLSTLSDGGFEGIYVNSTVGLAFVVTQSNDRVHELSLGGFDVSAQENAPKGVFFKPDGTKMYIVGSTGDDVNEYDLSTEWDTSTASFLQNFSVSSQETTPQDLFFKPDGTKMYICGSADDDVNEYDLSTAWDISSATFNQTFDVSTQQPRPEGIFFRADGAKMYTVGTADDEVNEYDLSVAWDISSASFVQNFSVSSQESLPVGVFFKDDGLKMYIIGSSGDEVNQYDLSTAWDISSASFIQNFSVSQQGSSPQGFFFKPDGTQMFTVDSVSDAVFTYSLGVQE